jgi:hypothetical protein
MAGANIANLPNNWWYSFNIGNAHIVSLNAPATSLPLQYTAQSRYHWDYPAEVGQLQYDWLKQDLAAARANTSAPWIFVYSHYPMYCRSPPRPLLPPSLPAVGLCLILPSLGSGDPSEDCGWLADVMRNGIQDPPRASVPPCPDRCGATARPSTVPRAVPQVKGPSFQPGPAGPHSAWVSPGWEPLLKEFSVDMYISAHVHNYERFLPVFNGTSHPKWRATPNRIEHPDAPVHVVTGAAGNVEDRSSPLPMAPMRTNAAP